MFYETLFLDFILNTGLKAINFSIKCRQTYAFEICSVFFTKLDLKSNLLNTRDNKRASGTRLESLKLRKNCYFTVD